MKERMSVPMIHHARDLLEPLRELDVVHRGVDGRERAEHVLDRHARRERRVALRIERLGLRHAARHPEHDDRVGGGASDRRLCRAQQLRLVPDERAQRARRRWRRRTRGG